MKVYKNEHLMICFDNCSNSSCGCHFIFDCDECKNVIKNIFHIFPVISERTTFEIIKYKTYESPGDIEPIVKTIGIKNILKILANLNIDIEPHKSK